MGYPQIAYGTPRKLPKAKSLPGRVAVLDIAFASNAGGASFEKVTKPFIDGLGDRLAVWIDHHDHELHPEFAHDPRFILRTKAQHGACPEMVTKERVLAAGPVDTICCHTDFDGLCSAAKWILGGEEPYEGADDDARAIDTRLGTPSPRADVMDRALRARPRDDGMRGMMIRFLVGRGQDTGLFQEFTRAADELVAVERETRRLAQDYTLDGDVAFVDATYARRRGAYDKTLLLLLGQERAPISLVLDDTSLTAAARFDSGIDLLRILGISGGMPTRVSVSPQELPEVLQKLKARPKSP